MLWTPRSGSSSELVWLELLLRLEEDEDANIIIIIIISITDRTAECGDGDIL